MNNKDYIFLLMLATLFLLFMYFMEEKKDACYRVCYPEKIILETKDGCVCDGVIKNTLI